MKDALIGYTGFVGSVLDRARRWEARYNSANIGDIAGQSFDRVVCAGTYAVKWWAEQNPAQDMAEIERLITALAQVRARHFTLVSTVDVYHTPRGVNETTVASEDRLHAYGRHRLFLEQYVSAHFEQHLIVRLPALFGLGLKKNVLFDLIHGHRCGHIDPTSVFQWYPIAGLPGDLSDLERSPPPVINLATEPILTGEILHRYFPDVSVGPASAAPARYDVHTVHAGLLGAQGAYVLQASEVLREIEDFIAAARSC